MLLLGLINTSYYIPRMGGSRLGPRVKVLRFAFLGGKRFEVQGLICQKNFFPVQV
jgi:hypothetical protein